MSRRIIVSRRRAAELAGVAKASIDSYVQRGRLEQGEALIDLPDGGTRVVRGVTFESLCAYYGWSAATRDLILQAHAIDPLATEGLHLLTTREEGLPE